MEQIENYYLEENEKFLNIRASDVMNRYFYRTTNLMNSLTESKNNSTEKLKNLICEENISCKKYLDSKYNFFDSGIDFGFKSGLTYVSNMYLDYKILNNKYDINLINSSIINSYHSHFKDIGLGLNNLLLIVLDKLFHCFKDDVNGFLLYKIYITKLLNIIAIILSSAIFIFIIGFIFISISNYVEPIKESAYRLSCSFYKIKKLIEA